MPVFGQEKTLAVGNTPLQAKPSPPVVGLLSLRGLLIERSCGRFTGCQTAIAMAIRPVVSVYS